MLQTMIVALREGVEAALIVGIKPSPVSTRSAGAGCGGWSGPGSRSIATASSSTGSV